MNYISADSLTNIAAEHHSNECLSVEKIEHKYGAELLSPEDINDKILVIKVNKLYDRHITSQDLYELDENQLFYLYKFIEKLGCIQKSQNPIAYIGV